MIINQKILGHKKSHYYKTLKDHSYTITDCLNIAYYNDLSFNEARNNLINLENNKKKLIHPPITLLSISNENKIFWLNLERILQGINMSDDEISSRLRLKIRNFRFLRSKRCALPLECHNNLSQIISFPAEVLYLKDLDFMQIIKSKNNLFSSWSELPQKYLTQTGSKMKTLENAYLFLKEKRPNYNWEMFLLYLQINPDVLKISEKLFSLTLFVDLHKQIRNWIKVDDLFFVEMGYNNLINKKNISQFRNYNCLIDNFSFKEIINLSNKIEINYTYQILFESSEVTVLKSKRKNDKKNNRIGSWETSLYVLGHICASPIYFNNPPIAIHNAQLYYNAPKEECLFIVYKNPNAKLDLSEYQKNFSHTHSYIGSRYFQ